MNPALHFTTAPLGPDASAVPVTLSVVPMQFVIAGWTGRNAEAIEHHIQELAALGIARPSQVPLYYRAGAALLTTAPTIETLGHGASGEAEPMLMMTQGQWWLGLGSDHTDREVESYSVAVSKQMCAKPLAPTVWRWADVQNHQDQLQLQSEIWEGGQWVTYQQGLLSAIRPLQSLRDGFWPGGNAAEGSFMLCGTLGAITNASGQGIRWAEKMRLTLHDPVLGRSIVHTYAQTPLDLVS
jgi:hypothetical protein